MAKKQNKEKRVNLVIDANRKSEGIPDHMIDTLDKSYHFIEELCISAHALSIHKEFLQQLSDKDRDNLTRLANKVNDIMEGETPQIYYALSEILFVNSYARLFDMGIVSIFNEIKMERETVAHQIHRMRKDKSKPDVKPPGGVEVA